MILYDQRIPASLIEFGIQIPVKDSRSIKTFKALLDDPKLLPLREHWHHDRIVETISREDLLRVHSANYVNRLYSDGLEQEIISTFELIDAEGKYYRYAPETATRPLTDLFERLLTKAAGSIQAARLALDHGFCFSFTGGAHHAQHDFGKGFCMMNDIVIAARKLQHEKKVDRVWVIDVDAHKGDGTAALTAGDSSIRTLSVHMASGWPLDEPAVFADGNANLSFIPSDIDIPIESGEEGYYIERLQKGLNKLAENASADLAIVVCGADPYENDELPSASRLKLSLEQMFARDQLLYTWLMERNIPSVFLMAGGYGEDVWRVYAQFLRWVLHLRHASHG
ncbi:histone deacetylase family protein [Desulfopila aestuarii]|uniref:Acetoin utilization deacetylase AcuC n=1 Tax=Desulfopila aestuarii DSM 18488 TaxID=1121416 RepID=A0A1M7YJ34_9BACT|nr:histone deacetylase [Desulfopila aestuarii]SHO52645.1 Acetoin utilization deacetylase AcuC [Desulfopila aestuarii DSM 18488]